MKAVLYVLKLNVLQILENQNKSKYWLYQQLDCMSYTNFDNIIKNKTKSIKYANIEKLCNILNVTPDQLFNYKQ